MSYVRLDQWLGKLPEFDGAAALREVALRYFRAYGPATPDEFARWFLVHPRSARELVHSLESEHELERVEVEGRQAWLAGGALRHSAKDDGSVHLLPHFDCYVVGCHPRAELIPERAPAAIPRGTAAMFSVVLINGVVGGLWERRKKGKTFVVRVDTFDPLSASQQQDVEHQAQRVGEILESPVVLELGHVEPRGHM